MTNPYPDEYLGRRLMPKHDLQTVFHYLNGWSEGAEGFPDGAWEAYMMEGVDSYNELFKTAFDPHDTWMEWLDWRWGD